MHRRTLLKLTAAASLTACQKPQADSKKQRVLVVGAGIVGASIAYHLAKAGALVTVIDQLAPASHASRGTFAWINATWAKQPQNYHSLSQKGVSNWHELQKELNLPLRWGGSLEWFAGEERQKKLAQQIAEQAVWGERARMVEAQEMAALEPQINFQGAKQAALSENDGAVDPVLATKTLLKAARNLGATIQYPTRLIDVTIKNGRLSKALTDEREIKVDKLVLATGAASDMPQKIGLLDIPQRSTPGIIAITKPMPRLLNRVVAAPGSHMHQRRDGRIVLGEQDGVPGTEAHDIRLRNRPNDFPHTEIAAQHYQRMLAAAEPFLPSIKGAELEDIFIGWRPLPLDGHPVLGSAPQRKDVYISIMHSGITLAPVVGQLAAWEILNDARLSQLNEFRPEREIKRIKRY